MMKDAKAKEDFTVDRVAKEARRRKDNCSWDWTWIGQEREN